MKNRLLWTILKLRKKQKKRTKCLMILTAAVVSKFLEENDFDLENVEMPEFNILDVQTNVPNSNGNTNENAYQTKAQPGRFLNVSFEDINAFLSSNYVTHEIHTTRLSKRKQYTGAVILQIPIVLLSFFR